MNNYNIPLLHDHHSHPLFYSAFGNGVSLEQVETQEEANDLLVAASQGPRRITVAHGWRSNRFSWSDEELESLPPVGIFNVSLHSLLMNQAGRKLLHDRYGDAIENLADHDWYESNLRVVLNWFANLNASAESLHSFMTSLPAAAFFQPRKCCWSTNMKLNCSTNRGWQTVPDSGRRPIRLNPFRMRPKVESTD